MQPTALPDALTNLANRIVDAGVPATIEAARVQLPGAFVTIGDLDAAMLARGWLTATAKIHLLARDSGQAFALSQLMEMLETVQESGLIPTAVEPSALDLPSVGTVPALTLTVSLE